MKNGDIPTVDVTDRMFPNPNFKKYLAIKQHLAMYVYMIHTSLDEQYPCMNFKLGK